MIDLSLGGKVQFLLLFILSGGRNLCQEENVCQADTAPPTLSSDDLQIRNKPGPQATAKATVLEPLEELSV